MTDWKYYLWDKHGKILLFGVLGILTFLIEHYIISSQLLLFVSMVLLFLSMMICIL